jgi:hypothetical protein
LGENVAERRRFFYNNDGSFLLYTSPPLAPDDFVYEAMGRLIGSQVDAVVCHMFGYGDAVPLYPTEVPEARGLDRPKLKFVSEWRQQQTLRMLWAEGHDPWQRALEAAHGAGMQYWAGMRFNDLHGPRFQWPSEFRVNHPEYVLGEHCGSGLHGPGSVYGERCPGLNFAIEAVRAQRLALVEEVCTRYGVDGFEWDFLREPGHHFPNIEEGRPILTEYMRHARAVLHRIGERRGRPVGFGVRVPGTPEKCREIGLDLETWVREGLVDYISPAPHWDTATDLPFDAFVGMARGTECRVYACTSEQVGPGRHHLPPPAALRAGALNAWRQGVDGIYVFNFHHQTTYAVDDADVLHQLGHTATLEFEDKLYAVAGCYEAVQHFPHGSTVFQAFSHQLPLTLPEQPTGTGSTIRFTVGDDLATAARRGILAAVTLELAVVGLTSEDVVEFKLNGRALTEHPRVELYPLYRMGPRPNSYHGNYTLTYDLREGGWIRQGTNQLEAALRRRNPQLECDVVLHDLSLEIQYRILPIRA